MWKVKIEDNASKEFAIHIKEGRISEADLEVIRVWYKEIESGRYFERILHSSFWNDHPLDGEWMGFRSSSYSNRGRIIYKHKGDSILIKIVRITPDHDYRR